VEADFFKFVFRKVSNKYVQIIILSTHAVPVDQKMSFSGSKLSVLEKKIYKLVYKK
jgi:hypothetical protein